MACFSNKRFLTILATLFIISAESLRLSKNEHSFLGTKFLNINSHSSSFAEKSSKKFDPNEYDITVPQDIEYANAPGDIENTHTTETPESLAEFSTFTRRGRGASSPTPAPASNALTPPMPPVMARMGKPGDGAMDPDSIISGLFDLHNELRTAAGLNPLKWDDSLAQFEKNYAATGPNCFSDSIKHSAMDLRAHVGRFKSVGENLWKSTLQPTAELVGLDWYNELFCYKYGPTANHCTAQCDQRCLTNSPRAGCQTGHFTQLMWAASTHVGCSVTKCSYGGWMVVGCAYGNENGGTGGNEWGGVPFDASTASRLGLGSDVCGYSGLEKK